MASFPWEWSFRVGICSVLWLVVELIDEEGDPVSEIFARVERTFEIPRMVKAVNPNQVDEANLWLRRER